MTTKAPQSKPPPKPARHISPAERAWLDRINRQLPKSLKNSLLGNMYKVALKPVNCRGKEMSLIP